VPGRAARRDDDNGDAVLRGDVPQPVGDLGPDRLGQAGVHRLAHATSFQVAQVFDVDDGRADGNCLVGSPPRG
jgi:hypothetical protein